MAKIIPLFWDTLATNELPQTHQSSDAFLELHQLYPELETMRSTEKGFYQAKVIPLPIKPIPKKQQLQYSTKMVRLFPPNEKVGKRLV